MLTWLMYLPHWRATEDKATKLGVFATGPALKTTQQTLFLKLSVQRY